MTTQCYLPPGCLLTGTSSWQNPPGPLPVAGDGIEIKGLRITKEMEIKFYSNIYPQQLFWDWG